MQFFFKIEYTRSISFFHSFINSFIAFYRGEHTKKLWARVFVRICLGNHKGDRNCTSPRSICSLKTFTNSHLFQIAREKSCDYLLIIYMRKSEIVKQRKRTRITQSGKNCAINCAFQTKPYCLLPSHNPEFWRVICTVITLFALGYYTFCTVLHLNCTASQYGEFFHVYY